MIDDTARRAGSDALAVVTGGASGIGLALARDYARSGCAVLLADIDERGLQSARDELSGEGADIHCAQVDLRDPDSVARLGDTARELGRLSAVCLNAGVMATGSPIWETTPEVFDFLMDVNLRGLFLSVRTFIPILLEQGQPADVVVTASMAGMVSSGFSGSYSASKSGAIALTKALRVELASLAPHLRVVLLNPGMVRTNLIRRSAEELGAASTMDADTLRAYHDGLNEMGVAAEQVAGWARVALKQNRFWAFPPNGDTFTQTMDSELEEIRASSGLG